MAHGDGGRAHRACPRCFRTRIDTAVTPNAPALLLISRCPSRPDVSSPFSLKNLKADLEIEKNGQTCFFGVFDGHGGREVALYCARHLHNVFKNSQQFAQGASLPAAGGANRPRPGSALAPPRLPVPRRLSLPPRSPRCCPHTRFPLRLGRPGDIDGALIASFLEMDTRIRTKEGQRELAKFTENSGASDNDVRTAPFFALSAMRCRLSRSARAGLLRGKLLVQRAGLAARGGGSRSVASSCRPHRSAHFPKRCSPPPFTLHNADSTPADRRTALLLSFPSFDSHIFSGRGRFPDRVHRAQRRLHVRRRRGAAALRLFRPVSCVGAHFVVVKGERTSSFSNRRIVLSCNRPRLQVRGRTLTVANAGDSRCVLCRNGQAVDMSVDHKPTQARRRRPPARAPAHLHRRPGALPRRIPGFSRVPLHHH